MGRLQDKLAIVTGAGGDGMGRAVSVMFAKEGAKVVATDIVVEGGEETVSIIKEAGGEKIFVKADICRSEDVKKLIAASVDTYGKLSVLYNNAAICPVVPMTETSEEVFDKIIAINLKGTWLTMKYAIPEMIKAGGGSIVNVASIAADAVQSGISIYGASKAGIIALTKYAAVGVCLP